MIKCSYCGKEIKDGRGKVISIDGDFVCDDNCHKGFHQEMGSVCQMSDSQFYAWMGVSQKDR